MSARPIVSPEGQSATFVELFFDLVFVFGVTQVVGLLHHDLSWVGAGRALLVFWLVWWAWTQFTWALNAADTEHPLVELGTLVATAVAFFMAVSIPGAFGESASWFAVSYVLVRSLGLWIYLWVAAGDSGHRAAVRGFATLSVGGLATALAGGFAGGDAQIWFWAITILLDVLASWVGASTGYWRLHAEHFAERHGLIVIIALGESLIVAAAGLSGRVLAGDVLVVAALSVLISCALWWTYFPVVKPQLEHALKRTPPEQQGRVARDTFSLAHFPMLCGVVAYAVALEEAIGHPSDPLPLVGRAFLGLGILLFVAGTALAMARATCGRPVARTVIVLATAAAVVMLAEVPVWASMGIALAGVAAIAVIEERKAERMAGAG